MVKEPGRNDPCWCGSGKKYKKCHLNSESEHPLPPEAILAVARGAWDHKECLHPSATPGVCDKIVLAHTIQKSGPLRSITDSTNHVKTFYRPRLDSISKPTPRQVGLRDASTFTGFCAKHDSLTFKPLETTAFIGNTEQCFLIGYRALCHQVYQKSGALKAIPIIMKKLDDSSLPVETQKEMQHIYTAIDAGTKKGLNHFQKLKAGMDKQLTEADYSGWSRVVVNFRGDLCVASTGSVSPNCDFDGKQLQVLHDPQADMESLLFGMVATSIGGAVVLTWLSRETKPRAFIDSLLKHDNRRLPGLLVQFIFAYIENTYFSISWWESLSEADRQHIGSLARVANPYYTEFHYSLSKFVPWEITSIAKDHS